MDVLYYVNRVQSIFKMKPNYYQSHNGYEVGTYIKLVMPTSYFAKRV